MQCSKLQSQIHVYVHYTNALVSFSHEEKEDTIRYEIKVSTSSPRGFVWLRRGCGLDIPPTDTVDD
jgi:hypothetical protein